MTDYKVLAVEYDYAEIVRELRQDASTSRDLYLADAIEALSVECKEWKERGDALGKALNVAFSDFAKFEKNQSWISVTERLPEESEGLNWHEDMMIRFTSVWCCDAKTGTIEVRNRLQGKMTGNEYLDQYTKDTDWHWSKSWWEPTHWMPIVPPPQPPKGE